MPDSTANAAQTVTLAWDPSSGTDVAGYQVRYGTSSGSYSQTLDAGTATVATIANLTAGTTYFFVATAYSTSGLESAPSNEVSFAAVANQAPVVALADPRNGAILTSPASITFAATASDPDGSISRVEFYSGQTKLGQATASPYTFVWNGVAPGSYSLSARAFDNEGASAQSAMATVTVQAAGVSGPVISGMQQVPGGGIQFQLTGAASGTSNVYWSSDLTTWTLLTSAVSFGGTLSVTDPGAASMEQRFYRVTDSTTTTDPAGFKTVRIAGANGDTPVFSYPGTSLVHPLSYQGSVSAVGDHTLTDAQAPWSESQFNGTNGAYFIEIVSGPRAGLMSDIVATAGAARTLTLDDDLTAQLAGGELYKIRKHRTIGDVFGANNEAGLQGGASISIADELRVFNPVTQRFVMFYYKTGGFGGVGWRSSADALADASQTVLYPDQGLIIRRKAAGARQWKVLGSVKTGATVVPIGPETNLVANPYPAGRLTLGNSSLYTGGAAFGVAGAANIASADEVRFFDTAGTLRKFYYKTAGFGGTGWRDSADALTDASLVEIPAATSLFIIRKDGRTAFQWTVPQPF